MTSYQSRDSRWISALTGVSGDLSPDMRLRLCVQTRCLLMHGTDYKQSLLTHKGKSEKRRNSHERDSTDFGKSASYY